jgi:hypothetical protein
MRLCLLRFMLDGTVNRVSHEIRSGQEAQVDPAPRHASSPAAGMNERALGTTQPSIKLE